MATGGKTHLLEILEDLEKNQLKKFQWYLQNEVPVGFNPISKAALEKAERTDTVDKMVGAYKLEGALKITVEILKKIKRNDLSEKLRTVIGVEEAGGNSSTSCLPQEAQGSCNTETAGCAAASGGNPSEHEEAAQRKHEENIQINKGKHQLQLKSKYEEIVDGMKLHGVKISLDDIYTELYITEAGGGEINDQHEVRQIEGQYRKIRGSEKIINFNNIFKPQHEQNKRIRTVLTKGIAGIGKTFLSQKFALDWANNKENQEIDFIFPLAFRELNLLKHEAHTLIEVIQNVVVFQNMEEEFLAAIFTKREENERELKVLFILDGLDEFQMPLNNKKCEKHHDVTEPKTIDVLLTNLIKGKLLPSALIWITTRPAAASQIPPECVDLVTEVRGFNDAQKDEYFMKRCSDEDLASRIISHIKASRILYIMCHIPVFSWITFTVLVDMLKTEKSEKMPKTLTEMYANFLVLQTKQKKVKYHEETETDPWDEESIQSILSLGKLAFHQLDKGNLIFYEKDLTECGIDVHDASVYSGVFTQIFSQSKVFQEEVFCFVHLSFQEFLAAVFVFVSFINNKQNLMSETPSASSFNKLSDLFRKKPEVRFYQRAVDKALQSKNGHLDLFLRFLLGLSLESNQTHLRGLLTQIGSNTKSHEKTVSYIKKKIREEPSAERCMNLFHCLNELNDHSLVEEIQHYLNSGSLSSEELSSTQWSALVFVLRTSEEKIDVFDLKKYSRSEEGLLRLLPVIKDSKTALLNDCNLSERCCEALASALPSSDLRELNMRNNNLGDSGMKLLSAGLENPLCKLETLRLSGCHITEEGCASLGSVLKSTSFLRQLYLSNNDLKDAGMKLLSAGLEDPLCKLETLRLSGCHITEEGCASLGSALKTNPSLLKDLDLSNNDLRDSGLKLLSAGLEDPHCKLETLRLSDCHITEEDCASLGSVLKSTSFLRQLDLGNNDLKDAGVKLLSAGLGNPLCKLDTLRMSGCHITEEGCASLGSVLKSTSFLRQLDLSNNDLKDAGMKLLSAGLEDPLCELDTLRLSGCQITEEGCASLGSVLKSTSFLRQLDLSNNDLKDAGMKLLSAGLGNPVCKLETLRLSGCLVTEEGCASLASALKSNPLHLRELDLNYNYPGEKGLKLLSAGLKDPHYTLEKLNVDHGGECRIKPGLRKYACDLTLDPNTVTGYLSLSEENRKVTRREEEQQYPDHPERFDYWDQVLCREGLSGRCYWEAEWSEEVYMAVTYKGISRRGKGDDCWFGHNNKSWSLYCHDTHCSARHNNKVSDILVPPSRPHRVGVYLDWPAGTLSFYTVSSDTLTHLHTFHSTFTEPLYPGFYVYYGSSVSLCQVE